MQQSHMLSPSLKVLFTLFLRQFETFPSLRMYVVVATRRIRQTTCSSEQKLSRFDFLKEQFMSTSQVSVPVVELRVGSCSLNPDVPKSVVIRQVLLGGSVPSSCTVSHVLNVPSFISSVNLRVDTIVSLAQGLAPLPPTPASPSKLCFWCDIQFVVSPFNPSMRTAFHRNLLQVSFRRRIPASENWKFTERIVDVPVVQREQIQ